MLIVYFYRNYDVIKLIVEKYKFRTFVVCWNIVLAVLFLIYSEHLDDTKKELRSVRSENYHIKKQLDQCLQVTFDSTLSKSV